MNLRKYYVSIVFEDPKTVTPDLESLDRLAKRYGYSGRGHPEFGLPNNPLAYEGQLAYIFKGQRKATNFSSFALSLDSVLEVRIGRVIE